MGVCNQGLYQTTLVIEATRVRKLSALTPCGAVGVVWGSHSDDELMTLRANSHELVKVRDGVESLVPLKVVIQPRKYLRSPSPS